MSTLPHVYYSILFTFFQYFHFIFLNTLLLFLFVNVANGLSQRNVLKLKQHQQQHRQSTTSHLVNNNKDNVLSGCQTQTNIEMNIQPSDLYHLDAPTAVEDDDSFSRNKDLTNVIVHAKLVNTADEKPCGQSTYNQLRRYKDCGLQDTKALLPVFVRSSDDLDTKVVTRRVTPRGKFLLSVHLKFSRIRLDSEVRLRHNTIVFCVIFCPALGNLIFPNTVNLPPLRVKQ